MATERELRPTFDPREPTHNPVTQTPAPATQQPVVEYVETDGKTHEEILTSFATMVAKDGRTNQLRGAAAAVLAHVSGQVAPTVPITKYHDEPMTEAKVSVPVARHAIADTPYEELSPTEKSHVLQAQGKEPEPIEGPAPAEPLDPVIEGETKVAGV